MLNTDFAKSDSEEKSISSAIPFYLKSDYNTEKPLLIYGYGMITLGFLPGLLSSGIKIAAIFDRNPKYHNTTIEGIPILPPDKIPEFDKDSNVFISTVQCKLTFTNMFKKYGFHKFYYSYELEIDTIYYQMAHCEDNRAVIESAKEDIDTVRSMLADKLSVEIFDARLHGYCTGDWEKLEKYYTSSLYFLDELFSFGNHEVFADCGAFDGETAFDFRNHMNAAYDYIYSFEPSILYCTIANRAFEYHKLKNAQAYQMAVCDKVGTVFFNDDAVHDMGGRISGRGEPVPATTLDQFFSDKSHKPTMIKMDIEGAELDALKGAAKIIQTYKPKLAICAYHKLEDIWELPLQINAIQKPGDYSIYLRHHSCFFETVYYAVPN